MDHIQRGLRVFVFVLIAAVVGFPAAAGGEIVAFNAGPSGVTWQPLVPFEHGVLTVASPDGLVFREEFGAGAGVRFSPFAQPGYQPPDGTYVWEVWLGRPSAVHPKLRSAAQAARESGDADVEAAHRVATARATQVQSGAFQILNGAIVPSNLVEPRVAPRGSGPRSAAPDAFGPAQWLPDDPSIRQVDIVQADDVIIQGSLCVGLDCVNNESFGFDTIRLKENNTRIKFEDTSTAAGFPSNDWQLTANDSASGGANKFSIEDITGAKIPFTVTAGAPTNSLFVANTGRVGLRTGTPVLDLHITTGDTPASRLEQNSSGGFTAQTWDVAGNEANFFVRDVTGGSRLPFRIRPGAPTSSIDIAASGNVGIGTAAPGSVLDVRASNPTLNVQGTDAAAGHFARIVFKTATREYRFVNDNGTSDAFLVYDATAAATRLVLDASGNVGIGTTTPTNPLQMASGALVTVGGVWTNASSRALKQDIRNLTAEEAQVALEQLAPVRYASTADPTEQHVGFIAEEVPDLVATKDRKTLSPMDIVAVLTRVVQEQQKTVEAQQKTIEKLASKIEALEAAPAR